MTTWDEIEQLRAERDALQAENRILRDRIARAANFPGPTYPTPQEEADFRNMRTRER